LITLARKRALHLYGCALMLPLLGQRRCAAFAFRTQQAVGSLMFGVDPFSGPPLGSKREPHGDYDCTRSTDGI
jgi:hypothetical protein